ncbi:MAG: glycoside hydrolase family 16 protein [Bacteroidales bacterium]|nr:glycoside hydrolase family 16 protein [Bacteroidales bacterium]
MKKLIICICTLLALVSCGPKEGWKLVWTENFDGPQIDTTVWTRIWQQPSDWSDMMSLREDLAFIENGELVLLGKVGGENDATPLVSGGIWSQGKKSFSMVKVEIRAKFNSVRGFWPALWLMPDAPLPEPEYAEIDIMEHTNLDPYVYQTVHSRFTLDRNEGPVQSKTAEIDRDGWNIYACEIHRDSICLFTNGVKSLTYPRVEGAEHQFPWADCPFYMILSNQLEGQWVGKVEDPADLPSELRIDWIKVYEPR